MLLLIAKVEDQIPVVSDGFAFAASKYSRILFTRNKL